MFISGMGLCPIAPPKGFPIALWKPSVLNTWLVEFRFEYKWGADIIRPCTEA